jgi:hypothetical protein
MAADAVEGKPVPAYRRQTERRDVVVLNIPKEKSTMVERRQEGGVAFPAVEMVDGSM